MYLLLGFRRPKDICFCSSGDYVVGFVERQRTCHYFVFFWMSMSKQ